METELDRGAMDRDWRRYSLATRAVRAGQYQDVSDQHSEPLVLTSSYVFSDAEDAAEKFAGRRPGNVYVRFTNPTVRAFEQRVAAMEGTGDAVATSSGMACYMTVALALLHPGDHVILAEGMFGTTSRLFNTYLRNFGVAATFINVDAGRDEWISLVQSNTKLIVVESPTNPMMQVADIRDLSAIARENGILLVVDNTLCTPVYQRPHELGANLIVHSAGKYIDGQGRCGGGIIAGREGLVAQLRDVLRTVGPSLSPYNAWIFLKSLETLPIRMQEHTRNASTLAGWLMRHPAVDKIYYTGVRDHPQSELIASQQSGHGGLLSFRIRGGRREAWRFLDALKLISNTTNIGDTKTMITHPATTTHGRLSAAERGSAGVSDNLLRISIGFEDPDDLVLDLEQAFHAAMKRSA
ncbi:MAG: aminotransferase class I/II-fold pyridoxal phosphate-dependent enzyme [Actinomycetota bacterium]|nr:aminotransferase class I/II-fold pyridoxal phosphate-dependent enzyme [Actinomycetota bacterium]